MKVDKNDFEKINKLEKAIEKKYGHDAVKHPKSDWSDEKEKIYLAEMKKLVEKEDKKVITSSRKDNSQRVCTMCNTYSMNKLDDLYLNKFDCCQECYFLHVEGRR
jgi:hypothetical protein